MPTPMAWRSPTSSAAPSRPTSQVSVARSLSASSREVPFMLQINEDVPPVPPLPGNASLPPAPGSMTDVSLSSPQEPSPSASIPSVNDAQARHPGLVLHVPRSPGSDPGSANSVPTSDLSSRLRSKYSVSNSSMRVQSATPASKPIPASNLLPVVPPPSQPKTLNAPRVSHISTQEPLSARSSPKVGASSSPTSAVSGVLTRIGTQLRKSLRRPGRYRKLSDNTDPEIPMNRMQSHETSNGSNEGDFVPVDMDISTLEGPCHLRTRPSTRKRRSRKASVDGPSDHDDILESKGQLTRGLGGGMDDVVDAQVTLPPNYRPSLNVKTNRQPSVLERSRTIWRTRNQPPPSPNPVAQAGQEAADRSGHVVAIEEDIVDLSNVEGGVAGTDTPKNTPLFTDDFMKQSYYFPPDPQMPNWRPLPMRPWYLLLLMSICVTLIGIFEHLVHRSGPPDTGQGLIRFKDPADVSNGLWFMYKYFGEIVLVSYGVMFQATDFEVRRLEPYYQMSRPTGSKAAESLNMDYLTFWSYLIPFKAVKHRQWAVVCSSAATIMASAIMPVLYSAAVNLNPPRGERYVPKGAPPITFKVQMDPVWTRIMEAVLALIFISTASLLFQQRRKSGLTGDLKGIAGIATMATKSHILNDFRGLDPASHRTIHRQLAHRRYILHKGSLWQGEYIMQTGSGEASLPKPRNPHPVALHLPIGLMFMFSLVLFIALLPVFEFNENANKVTDACPWFLPLLATLLKLAWTNLETGCRMIEPFYHLSRRHAPPSVLLLDYTGTIPGAMPIKAFVNKHFLLGAVGIGALLGEVLTVCVSSFNVDGQDFLTGNQRQTNSSGQTKRTFFTSLVLAEIIPAVNFVILAFVYLRRRHAFLPRQPGTIASVLAFVHQSRMLYDFVKEEDDLASPATTLMNNRNRKDSFRPSQFRKSRTVATVATATSFLRSDKDEVMDVAERTVSTLEERGKTYGLGWYRGRDGQDHVGVDEEELLHDYEHGVDLRKAHLGADIGRWEHL
ncbi:MAG: hypothetical protein Q9162_000783 [Coniocarpon cinnabarinum]